MSCLGFNSDYASSMSQMLSSIVPSFIEFISFSPLSLTILTYYYPGWWSKMMKN